MDNSVSRRFWAMRTSRDTVQIREYLWEEFQFGRLRQGWSYDARQNLHNLVARWTGKDWAQVDDETKKLHDEAWPNLPMLGSKISYASNNRMVMDDMVVIPNMPTDGSFSICRIKGEYYWDLPKDTRLLSPDYGSVLPVEVIGTGISKFSSLVSAELRNSIVRPPMRMWSLDGYRALLEEIELACQQNSKELQASEPDPVARVDVEIGKLLSAKDGFASDVETALFNKLGQSDWEYALKAALDELTRKPKVFHTGGVNEQGRDIELVYSDPFLNEPLIVAVQIKDWTGLAGLHVKDQLEEIVERYRSQDSTKRRPGHLAAIILAVTRAEASPELQSACVEIEAREKIPVRYVGRHQLIKLALRGFVRRSSYSSQ